MNGTTKDAKALENFLKELGPSESVDRFLRGYGNVRTRCAYAEHLALYLRWLKSKGVLTTPDALARDNLRAVFESSPTDVTAKRKHTDLMGEYINGYLLEKAAGDSTRKVATAAIRRFYESNDSPLFGYWRVAEQAPTVPPPPLSVEDIRRVLLAMPVRSRTPLVIAWQSAIEINRVLEADWSFAVGKEAPVRVDLQGRKLHRKAYSTFLGADCVEHLKLMGSVSMPNYSAVLNHLHFAARRLGASGLLKNPDLRSWHPHALRHSFSEECRDAKVEPEVREFFLGHLSGVKWVYLHGELHEEDFVKEYQEVEPYLSLNPSEIVAEERVKARFEDRLERLEREIQEYASKRNDETPQNPG